MGQVAPVSDRCGEKVNTESHTTPGSPRGSLVGSSPTINVQLVLGYIQQNIIISNYDLVKPVSCLICACRPMDRAPVFEAGNMGSIPIVRSMNSPLKSAYNDK